MDLIDNKIRDNLGKYLSSIVEKEFDNYIGKEKYERVDKMKKSVFNYRNASHDRALFLKHIGNTKIKTPRDRKSTFKTILSQGLKDIKKQSYRIYL